MVKRNEGRTHVLHYAEMEVSILLDTCEYKHPRQVHICPLCHNQNSDMQINHCMCPDPLHILGYLKSLTESKDKYIVTEIYIQDGDCVTMHVLTWVSYRLHMPITPVSYSQTSLNPQTSIALRI